MQIQSRVLRVVAVAAVATGCAHAQGTGVDMLNLVTRPAPVDSARPVAALAPADDRQSITVNVFEFGAVEAQLEQDRRMRGPMRVTGSSTYIASALGRGASDLIVEQLVATNAFRVLERRDMASIAKEQEMAAAESGSVAGTPRMPSARYVVSGSVSRLGFSDGTVGGVLGGAVIRGLWGLGARMPSTEVHLTARVIDTKTGEIVGSFTGTGVSQKGFSLSIFGMSGPSFGGGRVGTENFRESAIGEATVKAASQVVDRILRMQSNPVRGP
jgi:curli biogenesis system outer membrane secretion channel CsgG